MSADQFVLAKALYDNDAETSDELAFSKGDILTVLEFFPNGLDGWWLCSLRNKVGVCPGNRLQLLGHVQTVHPGSQPGIQRASGGSSRATSPASPRHHVRQASDPLRSLPTTLTSMSLSATAAAESACVMTGRPLDASTPSDPKRRNSNKVIIPQRVGEVYLYDVPDSMRTPSATANDVSSSPSSYSIPGGHSASHGTPFLGPTATYDTPRPHRTMPTSTSSSSSLDVYDVPRTTSHFGCGEDSYDVPRSYHSSRRSSVTSEFPMPLQDYDVPRNHQGGSTLGDSTYDIPVLSVQQHQPSCVEATYDVPPSMQTRSNCASLSSNSSSSSPSPAQSVERSLTPSLSLSSLGGGGSSSNRSSLEKPHELYDIPKPAESMAADQSGCGEGVYDVPPQVTRDPSPFSRAEMNQSKSDVDEDVAPATTPMEGKEIPLELDAAVEVSVKLQQEVQSAINKLFTLLGSSTNTTDAQNRTFDLKLCCARVRTSLQEFLDFANGALINSSKSVDQAVCLRLNKLLRPLQDANVIVRQTYLAIEEDKHWRGTTGDGGGAPDEMDRLVACVRTVIEDVRQVSCFIQGNSTLIFKRAKSAAQMTATDATAGFKTTTTAAAAPTGTLPPKSRERPLPPTPSQRVSEKPSSKKDENLYENDGGTWGVDDYDYVNLESKESYHRKNEEIKASLPAELHKSFDNLLKESLVQVDTSVKSVDANGAGVVLERTDHRRQAGGVRSIRLDANDRHVIGFYGGQLDEHSNYLSNAIQVFLMTVENNQPPKVFVDHGKFVILGAHKLVFIGDTIHRNVFQAEVRTRVQRCADDLCETLKTMVQRVKVAAQQFPSVLAVQEMVDSVVDVSHAACELKTVVTNLSKM